ncbi:MAG: hypothetical protein MUP58_00300 [Candidatus Nanohaloarchaeota archaeon QJJ-9]|nr:hypothetical protein [Candidatus Nanohaloarchaeota archaeon QJJ-9]
MITVCQQYRGYCQSRENTYSSWKDTLLSDDAYIVEEKIDETNWVSGQGILRVQTAADHKIFPLNYNFQKTEELKEREVELVTPEKLFKERSDAESGI